jgi:hypothetical protein
LTALLTVSQVDFHEVASYFQIKAPAARMRLMRLRQALEAESNREGFREKDRKRRLNPFKAKDKMYNHDGEDADDDEALDDVPLMQRLQARLMRIKREEGLMIKNEDGTLIKDEDGAMIKNEDDGFGGKKEEGVDEQEEKDVAGASYFKNETDDSRSDLQTQVIPVSKEAAIKPGNVPSLATQHTTPYLSPVKMELDPKSTKYGFGSDQHTSAHSVNFRAYGHANTPAPYAHEHNNIPNPEHININNNNNFSTPFNNYNTTSRPDTYPIFDSYAQVKPQQDTYGNTRVTPPSGHDSSFRLDMFNTALTNSVASPSGVEARSSQEYVDSVVGSPRIVKDDVEEIASDKFYGSPVARQAYQNNNFR